MSKPEPKFTLKLHTFSLRPPDGLRTHTPCQSHSPPEEAHRPTAPQRDPNAPPDINHQQQQQQQQQQQRRRQQPQTVSDAYFRPEVFVHANFRLLVEPNAEISRGDDGSDAEYVPWSHVVQAFVVTDATPFLCSICIEPPTPARITRCGHVYCLGCIARWFEASDSSSSSCPL